MTGPRWTDEVEARCTVEDVATELGWAVVSRGGVRGFPCPEHPEPHTDKRPTGRIVHGGHGWKCWRGSHGGNAIGLVSYALFGSYTVRGSDFHRVREWFATRGWCTPWEPSAQGTRPVPSAAPVLPPVEPEPEAPTRLPSDEVAALWDASKAPHLHDGVDPWLYVRGLDCRALAALDVARVVMPGQPMPEWAGFQWTDKRSGEERYRSWADGGWRLLLPVYDSDGDMVAMRARWTGWADPAGSAVDPMDPATYPNEFVETSPPFSGKEVSPRGAGACRAAVYADPVGRWLLRGGFGPVDEAAPGLTWDGRVLIVEGGPGFLHYATRPNRVKVRDGLGYTFATFGVWSGAWPSDALGERLAVRCLSAESVYFAGDDDEGGDRIAAPVVASFHRIGKAVHILGGNNG